MAAMSSFAVQEHVKDTHSKALRINLDSRRYGTFAEIGAGQEVVRWFFRVGGAAGTIAKSISAYDMTVSDAIYGAAGRYVSRQRLETMLHYEFGLMTERLAAKRGENTRFFVFADTITYTRKFATPPRAQLCARLKLWHRFLYLLWHTESRPGAEQIPGIRCKTGGFSYSLNKYARVATICGGIDAFVRTALLRRGTTPFTTYRMTKNLKQVPERLVVNRVMELDFRALHDRTQQLRTAIG